MKTCANHRHCIETAKQTAVDVCAKMGARFTPQRENVFDIIWQSHKALTAAEIMAQMDNKKPPITYRALDFLKNAGLIHHITSLNAYVGCMHAHAGDHIGQMLICTNCQKVTELEPEKPIEGLLKQANQTGFKATQTHIEMLGLCADCQ